MKLFRSYAVLALALLIAPLPSAAQESQRAWFEGGPIPLRYDLTITPDADAGTFVGEAQITIQSEEQLATVTMNALDLNITRATIDNNGAGLDTNNEAQTLTLTPRRPLRAGRHTIRIWYTGRIYDDAYGLFRVSYPQDGQTVRALATQFEVGDARRLAPMWDQPNRRAVFAMTVIHPSNQMVVSNMPAERTRQLAGGLTRTEFADSPSMSSYLLFLGMGDFERVTTNVDGVELGVVVRRGATERARYALQAGVESLRYFEEYFGIQYPLPKLDMVAVPGAGGFAAMENWGAILYFDQYILVDDTTTSEAERRFVFETVAHEIAHQWFGNLVTMTWWNDLWLNEGFASWMAAKAMERLHPDWEPWLSQRSSGTETAMALDAREGTHSVVQTVNTIDEANLAFDAISYEKGLAVIRMLEAYVGEDAFRQGVRDYLNTRLYGNSVTEDLWTAIQAASGQPVLDIARSYTLQPGLPIVAAQAQCPAGTIDVRQQRFALDDASRTGEHWSIPMVASTIGGRPVRSVLPANAAATVALQGACDGYILNAGQSGFFRVHYDAANFNRLVQRFATLDDDDQLGLMLDYWAFGRSGDGPTTDYLELVNVMPADADPVVVMDAAGSLGALAGYAQGRPSEAAVKAYAVRVLRPHFERWGWDPRDDETSNVRLARAALIGTLGGLGDEAIVAEARRRVIAMQNGDANALHGTVRAAARGIYAANANAADYDTLLAQARAATDFVEQRRLWLTLASAQDEALARRTLSMALTEDAPRPIRPQIVQAVAGSHPRLGWDFLVAHRPEIEAMLDPLQRLEYPTQVADTSSDPAIANELIEYARTLPEGAQPTVAAAVANIRLRGRVAEREMPAVERWIARHLARRGAGGTRGSHP